MVRLTPYGLFAIAASAAGTLDSKQLARLQVYLITYMAMALLLALWVLPGLVAALTPIPYRDVLGPTRDALITAFIAGDLFIVLPTLIESCRTLLARHGHRRRRGAARRRRAGLVQLPAHRQAAVPQLRPVRRLVLRRGRAAPDYPRLALTGLLTLLRQPERRRPVPARLFRIPADTFQLFLATSVINSRFGTLVAAVHTVAVALIGSAAVAGAVRLERGACCATRVTTLL